MRLLADVADDDVLDGGRLWLLDPEDAEAADDVGVHACSRVVLAQRVHVEHVYVRDGEGFGIISMYSASSSASRSGSPSRGIASMIAGSSYAFSTVATPKSTVARTRRTLSRPRP